MAMMSLQQRLAEIIWHIEQGETFESRADAIAAIEQAYRLYGDVKAGVPLPHQTIWHCALDRLDNSTTA